MIARCYIALAFVCTILSGCMFRPVTISTRHFALTPIPTSEPRQAALSDPEKLSVGIGFVKMPSYLLRNSIAVRNGDNEIEYLEDALWSERLDESFQRDLAANLAELLPSDSIYLTDWAHDQVMVAVYISVQQFDVDINGHGTLIAQWRITAPGSDVPLKSGRARLDRTGVSPRGKPEVVAETLSDLAAQFSRDLARSIRETRRS
ncbi:MAG TPA: PqiC family protein [Candidatus Baltobacteraceae bacterium]|jgi:uncharacterized lipoprotein YmbA|nr:PqiC family protein [Candidatus Baltobacteraceae bacterium]